MQIDEHPFLTLVLTLAILGGFTSCRRDSMVEIAGRVTVDGDPLAEGTISFVPNNHHGPSAGAIVQNGSYSLRLLPGSKTVRIEGFKTVGERQAEPTIPNSRMVPVKQQILSDQYNRKSTLVCNIDSANREYDFALQP